MQMTPVRIWKTVALGLAGLSALSFLSAIDAFVGIGAAQWLADLCLTEPAGMSDQAMTEMRPEVVATPLVGISMVLALAGLMTDRAAGSGPRSYRPARLERVRILAGMIHVAGTTDLLSPRRVNRLFELACGYSLKPGEATLALHRFGAQTGERDRARLLGGPVSPAERRRILTAAVLVAGSQRADRAEAVAAVASLAALLKAPPDELRALRQGFKDGMTREPGRDVLVNSILRAHDPEPGRVPLRPREPWTREATRRAA